MTSRSMLLAAMVGNLTHPISRERHPVARQVISILAPEIRAAILGQKTPKTPLPPPRRPGKPRGELGGVGSEECIGVHEAVLLEMLNLKCSTKADPVSLPSDSTPFSLKADQTDAILRQ